jgi:sporulation integral membrane protein YtvI
MFDRFFRENRDFIRKALFLVGLALSLYLLAKFALGYVAPFIIAYMLSVAFAPLVDLLQRKLKIARGVGTAIVILPALAVIGFVVGLAASRAAYEIRDFLGKGGYAEQVGSLGERIKDNYDAIIGFFPESLMEYAEAAAESALMSLTTALATMVRNRAIDVVAGVGKMLLGLVVLTLSTFFFTKDRELITNAVRSQSPAWLRSWYAAVKEGIITTLAGYVKAQCSLMGLVSVICVVGFMIMGFPYAFVLGVLTGVIDAFPFVGAGLVLWPVALIYAILGDYTRAVGALCVYAAVFLVRQTLEPKLLGANIGVHPLLMLVSVYLGINIYGLSGFIIGPLIIVMCKTVFATDGRRSSGAL